MNFIYIKVLNKIIITIAFVLLYSVICFADPVITNVTDNVITGSGFGTKATAAPIKFDDFESYSDGGSIIGSGSSPQWTTGGGITAETTRSHSGTKSAYSDFNLTEDDCSFAYAQVIFSDTDDFYQTYWVYWDNATDARLDGPRPEFFKMSRVSADIAYEGPPVLKPEFWMDYGLPEGLGSPRGYLQFQHLDDPANTSSGFTYKSTGGQSNAFTHGSWHRVEIFTHLSDTAGETWIRIDGQSTPLTLDAGDPLVTRVSSSSQGFNIFLLEISGCGYTATEHPYMWQDDIYIDNTRARVEIGNATTWEAITHREIQPATAWATGEITFTENQGTLGNTGYLYVVDADNLVNSTGTLYTFGEGQSVIGEGTSSTFSAGDSTVIN